MVMVIDGDGDGDEVDGEYEKWLLNMLHWWYAAFDKDFINLIYTNKANPWQSYKVTVINKVLKYTTNIW